MTKTKHTTALPSALALTVCAWLVYLLLIVSSIWLSHNAEIHSLGDWVISLGQSLGILSSAYDVPVLITIKFPIGMTGLDILRSILLSIGATAVLTSLLGLILPSVKVKPQSYLHAALSPITLACVPLCIYTALLGYPHTVTATILFGCAFFAIYSRIPYFSPITSEKETDLSLSKRKGSEYVEENNGVAATAPIDGGGVQ